jgi:hypothetical protein
MINTEMMTRKGDKIINPNSEKNISNALINALFNLPLITAQYFILTELTACFSTAG